MRTKFRTLLDTLPEYERRIVQLKETLLSNLIMISEIPAPSFNEKERCKFLLSKFTEYDLHNCSTDEVGNCLGILPGTKGDKNILIVAHLDTVFDETIDHSVTIKPDTVTGPGVGDNSLGLATISTLPLILDLLKIRLESNLVLMGSSRSLGRGNIEGLRFFLANTSLRISTGLCLEGVALGRLSYSSIGMMRCEISCRVPEKYDWTRFEAAGSIITINKIINSILSIPLPGDPRTTIVLGSVEGGTSYNTVATNAILRFEIRSESWIMVKKIAQQIQYITEEVSALTDAEISFSILANRKPGGIGFSHPLAGRARDVMKRLEIKNLITPSMAELSAFIDRKIPAVTLGLSSGENMGKIDETISVPPLYKGITQLIGLILAIDKGLCDEST